MTEQQTLHSEPAAESSQQRDDLWRKEIPARVAGYRHRRGRRVEVAFSMRFPFPATETEQQAAATENQVCEADRIHSAADDSFPSANAVAPAELMAMPPESPGSAAVAFDEPEAGVASIRKEPEAVSLAADAVAESGPRPHPVPIPRPRGKRKVIAFPRQASSAPEFVHRLADPVIPEQPRILDVPEELEAYPGTPLLDGLQFPPSAQPAFAPPADHIELPFQAVNISRRFYAGLIDCALVAVAAAVFGAISYKMLPKFAPTKPALLAAAAVLILLWSVYQYIFTMYGGVTPGMRMLGIRLRTFKGGHLSWRHRRSRVIGLYFSTASLMMGLFWVLVDVDALCWHDRISRTYLTNRE